MDPTKKQLKLMPEVLPAPTTNRAEGGPRSRTRDHMQRLLAAAALSGTLACSKDAVTQGYGVVDPMPWPAQPLPDAAADAHPAPVDAGIPRKDAANDATPDVAKKKPPPPHHPCPVVDPIPRPAGKRGQQ
jgi:hypothetical protein